MFRHPGIESFGVTILDANYTGDDSPIFTVREHKRVSLARAGQEAPRRIGWILPSAIVDISALGLDRLLILLSPLILFELPQVSRSRATPLFFAVDHCARLSNAKLTRRDFLQHVLDFTTEAAKSLLHLFAQPFYLNLNAFSRSLHPHHNQRQVVMLRRLSAPFAHAADYFFCQLIRR